MLTLRSRAPRSQVQGNRLPKTDNRLLLVNNRITHPQRRLKSSTGHTRETKGQKNRKARYRMILRKPPATTIRQVLFHGAAAVTAALLFPSCQHEPTPENLKPIYAKIDRKRPASLEYWNTKIIRGRNALDYGSRVSAMLAPRDATISLRTVSAAHGGTTVKCRFQGKPGKSYSFGSAVPLSIDGYFLTAAHCVGQKGSTLQILANTTSPPVSLALARVV